MKLQLKSDFREPWYDWAFDKDGVVFERYAKTAMDRPTMWRILEDEFHLQLPTHGIARNVCQRGDDKLWVAYLDPTAHRGEGKVVHASGVCLDKFPEKAVCEYIESARSAFYKSYSIRHLQIGNKAWGLAYESKDDWRSNCGDCCASVYRDREPMLEKYPMFAIDYVIHENGPLAIDLNTAPGLRWTGIDKWIKPTKVVELIKGWYERNANEQINTKAD